MSEAWSRERALRYAFWLLSRRDYAREEMRERLARKPVAEEVGRAVLARLEELGYLDDVRFARGFVRARGHRKGRWRLHRELLRRGVPEEAAAEALRPLGDDQQETAALQVLRKHAWRFASGDPHRDRRRAVAFLARRGFAPDAVQAAVERGLHGAWHEPPPLGDD